MKRLTVLLVMLTAAGMTVAQTMSISGTVTDAETNEPIVNARVHAMHAGMVYTDSAGDYTLHPMRAGAYVVAAAAEGYEPAVYPDTIYIEEGQTIEDIDFALVPLQPTEYGAISGTVTDAETGDPIQGARVHTYHRREAYTNEEGFYLLDSLPAGDYIVGATAEGYQGGFYPDTVTVIAGETTEDVDIALEPCTPGEFGAISGTVTDAETGDPIQGARVHTFHRGEAYTNEEGFYIIESLPVGDYIVSASAMGYQGETYPDTVAVIAGQTTEDIDFALERCMPRHGVISGAVTDDETGELIRGAVVRAENDEFIRQVVQGCRGYNIGMLPPGRYWVSATAPGYEPGAYPESVEVVVGQHVDGVDFTLEPSGGGQLGGIAGAVTNAETGDPLIGACVVAVGPMQGRANTDREGEYLIRDLLPGTYVVRAHLRGFEPSAPETVEVEVGQITEDVDFALVPMGGGEHGYVAGTVTDSATGDPIYHAHVFVRCAQGQGMAYTDSSGNYLLAVRPGAYLVRASARYHYPAVYPDTVVVGAGDTIYDVDFVLRECPRMRTGIAGFAFDGYSQDELGGARVTAIGSENSYETVTDEWGEYVFDDIEPGDYRIEVSVDGYETTLYTELIVADPDEVESYITPALYPLMAVEEQPERAGSASSFLLAQPNPITSIGSVRWQVPAAGNVTVRVVDNTGRVVATLQQGRQEPGLYSATWDARDSQGQRVANGVYFYQLDAPGARGIQKTVLMSR